MRPSDDPALLTPDQRLGEVASIMATGVLRPGARAALSGDDSNQKNSPNSSKSGLDVSEKTVLGDQSG